MRCGVARNDECGRRTQGRAGEIEDRPPKWAQEGATEEAKDRTGNEEDRPQGKEYNVAERRQQAEIVNRALDQRRVETIALEGKPDRQGGDEEPEHEAGKRGRQRLHSAGSRRPSG